METLCSDVLVLICSQLNDKDVGNLCQVCKSWKTTTEDIERVWKPLLNKVIGGCWAPSRPAKLPPYGMIYDAPWRVIYFYEKRRLRIKQSVTRS